MAEHRLQRTAFTASRLPEFCSEKELVSQTGHPVEEWPFVIAKELVDNALDIAEELAIAPIISIGVDTKLRQIVITDNGPPVPVRSYSWSIISIPSPTPSPASWSARLLARRQARGQRR